MKDKALQQSGLTLNRQIFPCVRLSSAVHLEVRCALAAGTDRATSSSMAPFSSSASYLRQLHLHSRLSYRVQEVDLEVGLCAGGWHSPGQSLQLRAFTGGFVVRRCAMQQLLCKQVRVCLWVGQ